ncbi:unnamed protein product, partial [Staurois parvus]
WSPRAIEDHGAPVSLPKLKKAYEKGTRGISWGPLLNPGPRAVPEFPNGQSAPGEGSIWLPCRGGLTTHGAPPGNRGSWGPCVLAQTQKCL